MKRLSLSLVASLLLHILLLYLFIYGLPDIKIKDDTAKKRVKLDLSSIQAQKQAPPPMLPTQPQEPVQKQEIPKEQPQPKPPLEKKMPQKEVQKEEAKKAFKKESKKEDINTTKITEAPKPPPKNSGPTLSAINSSYKNTLVEELYKDEFDTYTDGQKEFIKNSLDDIGRITQKYLRYPDVAGRLGQQGRSTIEFYLHPNGDISDLKLIGSSGYALLDRNSIHTIKTAYKDYPRPSETTKIRIYVYYKIMP